MAVFERAIFFGRVFEKVVRRCIDEGLVGGEGFAVDASLIQADANKQRSIPSDEWDPADLPPDALQAVKDYLSTLDDAAFGAASEVDAEVHLAIRSCGSVDRGAYEDLRSSLMPPTI